MKERIQYIIGQVTALRDQADREIDRLQKLLLQHEGTIARGYPYNMELVFGRLTDTCLQEIVPDIPNKQGIIDWVLDSLGSLGDYIEEEGGEE